MKKTVSIALSIVFLCLLTLPSWAESNHNSADDYAICFVEKEMNNDLVKLKKSFLTHDGNAAIETLKSWEDVPVELDSREKQNQLLPLENPRSVIGSDGRTIVSNTGILPYSAIVCLDIYYDGDILPSRGTGALISESVILTAGHCLYDAEKGWAKRIRLVPGKNGILNYPFGSAYSKTMSVSQFWYDSADPEYDWGVILFDNTFSSNPGYLQFGFAQGNPFQAKISGYPLYVGSNIITRHKQYEMDGLVYSSDDTNLFYYNIDTSGGQSGAPILNTNNVIVGIHTRGASDCNYGTQITLALDLYLRLLINSD